MKAILTFLSFILGLVVAAIIFAICNAFSGDDENTVSFHLFGRRKVLRVPSQMVIVKSLIWGAAVGFINRLAPYVQPVAVNVIFAFIVVGAMAYMVLWWISDGSTIKEMIAFIVIEWLLKTVLKANIVKFAATLETSWLAKLMMAIPAVIFVITIGIFVANYIWFHQELNSMEGGE